MYPFEMLIKSFVRFDKLGRLIESIRRYYPDAVVRIADDSPESAERDAWCARLGEMGECHFYRLPFNVGMCVGRNFLLRQVQTPYFVMLDDDLEFTPGTCLDRLQAVLDGDAHGVIAAGTFVDWGRQVANFHGHAKIEGREIVQYLYGSRAPTVVINGVRCVPCRMTQQFFMGRIELFRRHGIGWDERLKLREHIWFFLTLPPDLTIYHVPGVTVNHWPGNENALYRRARFDATEGRKLVAVSGLTTRRKPVILYETRLGRLGAAVRRIRTRWVNRRRRLGGTAHEARRGAVG